MAGRPCPIPAYRRDFFKAFKDFLLTTNSLKSTHLKLAQNSAASYYDKFALIVHQAFLDRYLPEDYTIRVERISNVESHQPIVDDNELKILMENPPEDDLVFKSSVFALMTGLRFSGVEVLRWSDFHYSDQQSWYIRIIDPKQERTFTHYISQAAVDFIGPIQNNSEKVFPGLTYSRARTCLQLWFSKHGLLDKAKFHSWRRKYATKLKEADTDTYIISKMLNHKHESTAIRYIGPIDGARVRATADAEYEFIEPEVYGYNESASDPAANDA